MVKITGLKTLLQGAVVAFALVAGPAHAVPVTPALDSSSAESDSYSFGLLEGANESDTGINLTPKSAFIDAWLTGSGSLTIPTFTNPFKPGATGLFDLLFGPELPASSVEVQWGSAYADLSDRLDHDEMIPYSMAMGGSGSASEDLVFSWNLGTKQVALSAHLAAVPAPAGVILLLTALGGIVTLRRRGTQLPAAA